MEFLTLGNLKYDVFFNSEKTCKLYETNTKKILYLGEISEIPYEYDDVFNFALFDASEKTKKKYDVDFEIKISIEYFD